MKTVLWISRHEMTGAQLADLERSLGDAVYLLPWRESVTDLRALAPLIASSDAVAAVLPPDLLSQLLAESGGRPVLRAISGREPTGRVLRLPDGRSEAEYSYVHLGWEQLLRADFVTRRL